MPDDKLKPGDYVIVSWTEGGAYMSAAGFFDHNGWWHLGDGHVWLVLSWGYAIDTMSDDFAWERAFPPEGDTYTPIDLDNR